MYTHVYSENTLSFPICRGGGRADALNRIHQRKLMYVHRIIPKLIYGEINSQIFKLAAKFRCTHSSSRLTNGIVNPNIDWNIVRNQNRGWRQWRTWFENLKLYCAKRYIVRCVSTKCCIDFCY